MTGNEFFRKIRKLGQRNGIPVELVGRQGEPAYLADARSEAVEMLVKTRRAVVRARRRTLTVR